MRFRFLVLGLLFAFAALPVGAGALASPAADSTTPTPAATPSATSLLPPNDPAVDAAIARMSKYGMEDPRAVSVIAVTPMTWPDDCLGLPSGLPCHASPTAGYAIQVEKEGLRYVVRTDSEGKVVRLASAPAATIRDAFLQWQDNDGKECRTALIGTEQLQYGFCGEALLAEPSEPAMWAMPGGESQAAYWQRSYAPFTADTVRGSVVFSGTGTRVATAAEQRAIAEWARERWMEHWSRYVNAVYNLDLGWTERNASFCGGLWIYRTGLAVAWNCKGSAALGSGFLQGAPLQQFYDWLDSDKRWSIGPKEEMAGLPPNTSLYFPWDDGTQNATAQDTASMLQFLHQVYSTLTERPTATGKVIAGYGAHEPIADLPLWIGTESHGAPAASTNANGEFTLTHLPVGLVDVVDSHLRFQVPVPSSDANVDLGLLKYPMVHPPLFYYTQTPAPLPSLSELLTNGERVPYIVCQTDATWSRPSEERQRDQVWSKRPFRDQGEPFLKWWFRQPAVIYDTMDLFEQSFPAGPNLDALAADWRYLTGLWTGDDLSHSQCSYDGRTLDALFNREQIEVWLIGYRALEVRRIAMPSSRIPNRPITEGHPDFLTIDQPSEHLAISVTPAPGFQIIRLEAHSDPLAVHVVQDGQELITLPKDCASPFNPECAN
jgi:hypothetical protein